VRKDTISELKVAKKGERIHLFQTTVASFRSGEDRAAYLHIVEAGEELPHSRKGFIATYIHVVKILCDGQITAKHRGVRTLL
jgi:hypothetical protein